MTQGQCPLWRRCSPTALHINEAGLLAMTGPTNSPVTSRLARQGGQVPAQCRRGSQQAQSSLGHHWPPLDHSIAQLQRGPWEGSWDRAQRWRSQERWPEKIRPSGALRVLKRIWINDRKFKRILSGSGKK